MPNTYSQHSTHCVFAVKGRQSFLLKSFRENLFRYMSTVLKNDGVFPLAVNGWVDHVHVFFELPMTRTTSDIMKHLKTVSSKWINEQGFLKEHFAWQSGYGSFAYDRSLRDVVIRYIINQEDHHSRKSFKDEYIELLDEQSIAYDDRYLFEFYSD
ncbi:MAG: transposase [Pedobacter sp.]|nr:MAG: transposase [Pedobacter sp.]